MTKRSLTFSYLDDASLKNLKTFRFISGEYTSLDLMLNGFWAWGATFIPHSISPNMVTLMGFMFFVSSTIPMFWQAVMYAKVENWVFLLSSLSVFVYQTFDAMDGKHARNTGMSSPLGALFDHCCDGICVAIMVNLMPVVLLDPPYKYPLSNPVAFACVAFPMVTYFVAQLYMHVTHLHFHAGATEAQVFLIVVLAVTGIYGPSILQNVIPLPGMSAIVGPLTYCQLIHYVTAVNSFLIFCYCVVEMTRKVGVKSLKPLLPVMGYLAAAYSAYHKFGKHPTIYLMAFSSGFIIFIVQIIISGICHQRFPLIHWWAVPYVFLNLAIAVGFSTDIAALYGIVLAWHLTYFFMMTADSINCITEYLGIPFLAPFSQKKD